MRNYGIFDNAKDFYQNLQINHKVTYHSKNGPVIGTVISLVCLGVRGITIIDSNKKKYIIFPKNCDLLEIAP